MTANVRGVVLVHVMILVTLMAWLASMFLSAVLSRQINAKQTIKSSEVRAAMNAAAARITSCLSNVGFPTQPGPPAAATCTLSPQQQIDITACHGGASATEFTVGNTPGIRPVAYVICGSPTGPPCRFRINVCEPGDTCAAPGAACP